MLAFLAPILKHVRDLATDYTTARAVKIDHLDADISAISPINSIQYGTITVTGTSGGGTATITAVNVAKTALIWLGTDTGASNVSDGSFNITLTNSTTVTASRFGSGSCSSHIKFCAVEFK